jgi:hypothetical protein
MAKFPKLAGPIPGPTEPPAPEPQEIPIPKMAQTYDIKQFRAPVWRVTGIELDGVVSWLIPLLREKWPNLNEGSIYYMLKSVLADKHTYFVRSENVCGLFDIIVDAMDTSPRMRERWVRSKKEAKPAEEEVFYTHVRDHAQQIGCTELMFNLDSNCAMTQTSNSRGISTILQDIKIHSDVKRRPSYIAYFREE